MNLTDNKKFWLVTAIYLVVFWILPTLLMDSFFVFIENILRQFNIKISGVDLYLLFIIPVVIILFYLFLLRRLDLKFKNILFTLFYLVLPYLSVVTLFLYSITKVLSNPHFLSF